MDQNDRTAACVKGCLLGGAVGDALGAPVEAMSLADIRRRFGRSGLADYAEAYGRLGAIGGATQMSLFVAEGLVRAYVRARLKGICSPPAVVHHALLRWLMTQGVKPIAEIASGEGGAWPDGWLVKERALWSRRAPDNACVAALSTSVGLGERAENDSRGCGTVMRVAPVGLVMRARGDEGRAPAFELGVEVSAVTHGHPAATLAGGAFALLIALLMDGLELRRAVTEMYRVLADVPGSGFVTRVVDIALTLAAEGGEPTPGIIESVGSGGWVAEEALAIAVYCALVARDFEHGVLLAVNHGGASNSTGSMTGQILGTAMGAEVIPARWLNDDLELRDEIERMAADLVAVRTDALDVESATTWRIYPGW
jgi:ADP-ribosylglycohydrolase